MDRAIDNAMLTQALALYEEQWLGDFSEDNAFEPSDKFDKKMTALIKSRDNIFRRATYTRTRKVIAVAAAIAVLLGSMMSVGAIRETILNFFITRGSNVNVMEYGDATEPTTCPKTIERAMNPGFVPDGYVLSDESADDTSRRLFYTKGESYITIEQFTKDSYSSASDSEFSNAETKAYEGTEYIVRADDDMTMLVWEKNGYVLELVGFEPESELLKTAASVN